MKIIRVLLIIGILGLLALVLFLVLNSSQEQPVVTNPAGSQTGSGGQQGITPIQDIPDTIDEPVDIIHNHFHDLEEVTVTREAKPQGAVLITDLVNNPSPEFAEITAEFYIDDYILMTCKDEEHSDRTIMFTAKPTADPVRNHYRPAFKALDKWAPFVPRDLGWWLYPDALYTESATEVRYDLVSGTDVWEGSFESGGDTFSIYYSWLLNYVFFSTSLECIDASKLEIYAPHTH